MAEFIGKIGTPSEGFTSKIVYEKTNDISNNRTIINSIKGYVKRNNSSYYPYNTTRSSSIKIERQKDDNTWETVTTIAGYTTSYSFNSDNYYEWASGSDINIPHKTNGNQQMRITFSVDGKLQNYYPIGTITKTIELDQLHQAPNITAVSLTETNTRLTDLGVANNTIVQYLSNKTIEITAPTSDNATITNYSVYHNNTLIGTSTTNTITINFANVGELIDSGTGNIGLMISVTDNLGGYSTKIFNFPVIKYTRPSIEKTSTTIKRKTGSGTVLTDNKVLLNFVGTCYKGSDVVGNNNKPKVEYKIWNGTEPSYSTLTTPNSANVVINNYEISNILYTSAYNYKIKITDNFTTTETTINLKVDKVPTGVSVWTEYKDRVDYLALTRQGKQIYANIYSFDEVIIGMYNDKPLYRKTINFSALNNAEGTKEVAHNISNLDKIIEINATGYEGDYCFPIPFVGNNYMFSGVEYGLRIDKSKVYIYTSTDKSTNTAIVILEYTKTSD